MNEDFQFKISEVIIIQGVKMIMEFFKSNFPESSILKFLYVTLIYTISLPPKLGAIL